MYTDIKSLQIVISLLKKYNVKNLVLSAGSRHTPFVRSVENDSYFNCYSIVDERSAGFFALGLIKELKEPVVIACTSGTAVSNYLTAVSEAFYAKLPLIVITADRNPYYSYQQEEQMVPQQEIFKGVCKKEVVLPFVKDDKDFWYCNRLVNEALGDIEYFGDGPVHIDVPLEEGLFEFNTEVLPDTIKINKVYLNKNEENWLEKAERLKNAKRILITYGQAQPLSSCEEEIIERFCKKFGAVIMVDHLSNLKCYGTVEAYTLTRVSYSTLINELVPDIVIAMNGNAVEIRGWILNCSPKPEFWNIVESGEISDPFRCLTDVFVCTPMEFFEKMLQYADKDADGEYMAQWKNNIDSIKIPDFDYSDIYAVREFMKHIPDDSILNLANSNSVRLPQHFELNKKIPVYCNRGVSGIDGSMSTFIGQSYVHEGLSFLLIGDLSFFYDMNALWNKYVKGNVRILMNNNECGEIFYTNPKQDIHTVGKHIAADHKTDAKGWVESRGFYYLKAETKEEYDENLKIFVDKSFDKPIFFEVFTDKYTNLDQIKKINQANQKISVNRILKGTIKSIIRK